MSVVLDEGYTWGSVYYSLNFGVLLKFSILKKKTFKHRFSYFSPLFNKVLLIMAIPFLCSGFGRGGRGDQTSYKPTFAP